MGWNDWTADKLNNTDLTQIPKLTKNQIDILIDKFFSPKKNSVVSKSNTNAIYNAQNQSDISALVLLAIAGTESGYGTSQIARDKFNLWGWNATDTNTYKNAWGWDTVDSAFIGYANAFKKRYYNELQSHTIYSMGVGANPTHTPYATNTGVWSDLTSKIMNNMTTSLAKHGETVSDIHVDDSGTGSGDSLDLPQKIIRLAFLLVLIFAAVGFIILAFR